MHTDQSPSLLSEELLHLSVDQPQDSLGWNPCSLATQERHRKRDFIAVRKCFVNELGGF